MIFSNKTYDLVKWIAQIFLPAVGALYFGLSEVWGLPKANEVIGTITVIDLFLGALLAKSNANYKKSDERFDGTIEVAETPVGPTVSAISVDSDIETSSEVTLKVEQEAIPVEPEALENVESVEPTPKSRAVRKRRAKKK